MVCLLKLRSIVCHVTLMVAMVVEVDAAGTKPKACTPTPTFAIPSSRYRPRFRYWVPDASVDPERIKSDIVAIGARGGGGIELLGFYSYGNYGSGGLGLPVVQDWSLYGWGTEKWRAVQDAAIQATFDNNLVIDLAMGGNQGAGVPAPYDSDGILRDVVAFNATLSSDVYDDFLPGWGTGRLISASLGNVISSVDKSVVEESLYGPVSRNTTVYMLSADSVQDVTANVSADGRLNLSVNLTAPGSAFIFVHYTVVPSYMEIPSPQTFQNAVPQSPVTSYLQNGSYVVDHFSPAGAQVVIDFWDNHLLNGSTTTSQLAQVGNYLWEDSQEYGATLHLLWTPDLPRRFEQDHGYSIVPYMPILFKDNGGSGGEYIITDEVDAGASHIADYTQTLTNLYQTYLSTLSAWARSHDMQLSAQPAYNQPVDMLQAIPSVDAPEIESLGFQENIDLYRQASGATQLAGKRVLSSECGAVRGEVYVQTIPELLWSIQRSFVGGVSNFVFHGFPYSGNYPNTTYPVFTTFLYLFSAMHGPHQPAWPFYSDFLDYTSRMQFVAQTSVSKVDIAFYLKSNDWISLLPRYNSSDLTDAGFTYQYVDPANFELPNAKVVDGVFAPDAQAFKALVIRSSDTLTPAGVQSIYMYASEGLPIIFHGGIPSQILGSASFDVLASVNVTMNQVLALSNVHQISGDIGLADFLASIGIVPRIVPNTASSWYTWYWHGIDSDMDYAFVYNDATGAITGQNHSTGTVTLDNAGIPYFYDAWTGAVSPVPVYSRSKSKITIPLQLAGNQTALIAFRKDTTPAPPYLNSTEYQYKARGSSILVCSSDPSTSAPALPHTASHMLGPWDLTIESWLPPANLSDIEGGADKVNITFSLPTIAPWSSISQDLANVSGVGYYTTSFNWSSNSTAALLDLGPIFNTASASINGIQVPPLDVTNAVADISEYLQPGQNSITITVATPLGNSMIPIWDAMETSGLPTSSASSSPGATDNTPIRQAYGLLFDVFIHPCTTYPL